MRRLVLTALSLICLTPGVAAAQSMNPAQIAHDVMTHVCGPFADHLDRDRAVAAAEAQGYRVLEGGQPAGEVQTRAGKVVLWRSHYGTISLLRRSNFAACSVGVIEGGVGSVARGAEQGLRDLGLSPVLDEREAPVPVMVWRGRGRQAVIVQTGHFGAGTELIVTIDPRVGVAD